MTARMIPGPGDAPATQLPGTGASPQIGAFADEEELAARQLRGRTVAGRILVGLLFIGCWELFSSLRLMMSAFKSSDAKRSNAISMSVRSSVPWATPKVSSNASTM